MQDSDEISCKSHIFYLRFDNEISSFLMCGSALQRRLCYGLIPIGLFCAGSFVIYALNTEVNFLFSDSSEYDFVYQKKLRANTSDSPAGTIQTLQPLEQRVQQVQNRVDGLFDIILGGGLNLTSLSNSVSLKVSENLRRILAESTEIIRDVNTSGKKTSSSIHLPETKDCDVVGKKGNVQDDSSTSTRLDCFDDSKCILVKHTAYGRSGNRFVQLRSVQDLLSRCSGAAISPAAIEDKVVHFPPFQVYGKDSCSPKWDQLFEMQHILDHLRSKCRVLSFSWDKRHQSLNCSIKSSPAFRRVDFDNRFPFWLEISLEAWKFPLSNSTAVLHFRGGDIFRDKPSLHYTQPVCDHYLRSFRHSGAACALLVAEDDRNPCVAVVEARLNCSRRPSECGPSCAFTLLARARTVISSKSTFVSSALDAFAVMDRRVYSSYCASCPRRGKDRTQYCTDTNRTELFPWISSPRQRELLATLPARLVLC